VSQPIERPARTQASPPRWARCGRCRHFCNDPQLLEQRIAGLAVLGSGWAAVRDGDGFCDQWQRYLSQDSRCERFDSE